MQFMYLAGGMAAVLIGGTILTWRRGTRLSRAEERIGSLEERLGQANEKYAQMLAMMRKGYQGDQPGGRR